MFCCGGGYKGGMKVCLDIQAALGQRAGVGRYVRELLWMPDAGGLSKLRREQAMNMNISQTICFIVGVCVLCANSSSATTIGEYETNVLTIYSGEFRYEGQESILFSNMPPVYIMKYVRPTGGSGDEYLLEFASRTEDGNYSTLLAPDLRPMGVPPTYWGASAVESAGKATITVLSKVQGNGGLWVKDTYQYDGVSISKTDSVSGIGDPYHKDPISGKYVPTPPSWWGPPVRTKWDRYQKDPETGATWMLVPDETKDGDTASGEEKARRYRQDPETGYWWKRVD